MRIDESLKDKSITEEELNCAFYATMIHDIETSV